MKKIILVQVLLLILFLSVPCLSQAQSFQSRSTGIQAGQSTNYISIVDDNVIWARSNAASLFSISTDGGNTWTANPATLPTGFSVSSMSATSATTAYICGNGSGTGVHKTTNGGITWTLLNTDFTPGDFVNTIHFFDELNGVVLGDYDDGYFEIYTTSNAGATWTRVPPSNLPAPQEGEWGVSERYVAVGSTIWFVSNTWESPTRLFKSTDKGITWQATAIDQMVPAGGIPNLTFLNQNFGILTYSDMENSITTRYQTNDGGQTFTMMEVNGLPAFNPLERMSFIPGTFYVVAIDGANSLLSKDFGANWTVLQAGGGGVLKFRK